MGSKNNDILLETKGVGSGRDSTENEDGDGEQGMTRAKWLACLSLGLLYTTSFQQGACLGAIVKSIDEALGKFFSGFHC
jgi:hypothetical protein